MRSRDELDLGRRQLEADPRIVRALDDLAGDRHESERLRVAQEDLLLEADGEGRGRVECGPQLLGAGLAHRLREGPGGKRGGVHIVTLPGVFAPISDSWMLADALRRETLPPGARVLDVCTGSGMLAVTAALRGASATAVDVSRRAVLTARLNARLNGVRVRGVRGDLLDAVRDERFDCIVSNPPYVPSPRDAGRGTSRAWEAGRDGRVVLDRICDAAPAHLREERRPAARATRR